MSTEAKAKRTPGPWTWEPNCDKWGCRVLGPVEPASTRTVITPFTCEANARLIAAAPDLFEAALEACDLLEGYVDVADGPDGRPVANKAMRAVQALQTAIAKSEGCQ